MGTLLSCIRAQAGSAATEHQVTRIHAGDSSPNPACDQPSLYHRRAAPCPLPLAWYKVPKAAGLSSQAQEHA